MFISVFVYNCFIVTKGGEVKVNEFRRWLIAQGVEVLEGSRHTKLRYNGKHSTLSRHGGKEMNEITRKAILKQLGL